MNNNALTQPARSREEAIADIAEAALREIARDKRGGHTVYEGVRQIATAALCRIKTLREAGE